MLVQNTRLDISPCQQHHRGTLSVAACRPHARTCSRRSKRVAVTCQGSVVTRDIISATMALWLGASPAHTQLHPSPQRQQRRPTLQHQPTSHARSPRWTMARYWALAPTSQRTTQATTMPSTSSDAWTSATLRAPTKCAPARGNGTTHTPPTQRPAHPAHPVHRHRS